MKTESMKLEGRVISVNAADQSFVIQSGTKSNRFRVYANDILFSKLNRTLSATWFNGKKGKEITGTFYVQGKVLMEFGIKTTNLHEWAGALLSAFKEYRLK